MQFEIRNCIAKENDVTSFWMNKLDLQEAKTQSSHENFFNFMTNDKEMVKTVTILQDMYQTIATAFEKCSDLYTVFLYCLDHTNKDNSPFWQSKHKSKNVMPDEILNWYHFEIYKILKELRQEIMDTDLISNIDAFLASLFPNNYTKDVTMDLELLFCEKKYSPIPVSLHDVIHWNSLILTYIDVGGLSQEGVPIFYKSWLSTAQMVYVYQQISVWIVMYIQQFGGKA